MGTEFPDDDLLAAYREGTRQSAPPSLAWAVRDRLSRSHLVLPKVVWACLGSSMGLAAMTAFLLTTREFSRPAPPSDPPPMFQSLQGDLFSEAVSLRSQ